MMLSDSFLYERRYERDLGELLIWGIIEGIVSSQPVTGCGTDVVAWLLVISGRIEAHQVIAGGA